MGVSNIVILQATRKLLQALIRILLRYGISHVEFAEVAKQAYVDVCDQYYSIPGRKKTVSRVAILSGLSRKEVLRLRKQKNDLDNQLKSSINRATRVISGWLMDIEFQDKNGKPTDLKIAGDHGSFQALVKRYSGDITGRAILDELIRIGAVEKIDNESVRLLTQGYIPLKSEEDKLKIMGITVSDLLTTINYNLKHRDYPHFQRQVIYTELPKQTIEEFKILSHEKSLELLFELNKWLEEKKILAEKKGNLMISSRVGLGVYYFAGEVSKVELDDKSDPNI